jgi:hypothetical protein
VLQGENMIRCKDCSKQENLIYKAYNDGWVDLRTNDGKRRILCPTCYNQFLKAKQRDFEEDELFKKQEALQKVTVVKK